MEGMQDVWSGGRWPFHGQAVGHRQASTVCPLPLRRVEGFPTIKAYVNGRMVDYKGERSARALNDWAISLIPNRVAQLAPSGGDKLEAFLQRCGGGGGAAAPGEKVLLCSLFRKVRLTLLSV